MKLLIALSAVVAVASAFVCLPDYCDNVQQPLLACKGGIAKGTGFCGCTDSCAKLENESCRKAGYNLFFGMPNTEVCDEGLECTPVYLENDHNAICKKTSDLGNGMLTSRRKRAALMVCPPDVCDNVQKTPLNCAGGIIKGGGFCGCTDTCALVEHDACKPTNIFLLGVPSSAQCDTGLACMATNLEGHVSHQCVDPTKLAENNVMISKRSACDTACRKKSQQCTFSMVIYASQWLTDCDLEGNFKAHQCTRGGFGEPQECFCVDRLSGQIDESTRIKMTPEMMKMTTYQKQSLTNCV